jgi:hypothetical protein
LDEALVVEYSRTIFAGRIETPLLSQPMMNPTIQFFDSE